MIQLSKETIALLEDIERRIDPEAEEDFAKQWEDFLYDRVTDPIFVPKRKKLAAAGVAWMMGIPGDAASRSLATFRGAGRRMEYKGTFNGADVYDDYAHHPGELAATIDAVQTMGYKRVIFAFQPHTYTRTKALFEDFAQQLKRPDILVLAEIYAARERNTIGISSRHLLDAVGDGYYCATLPEVTQCLRELAQPGDLILTVGAGDIYRAGEALLK